MCFLNSSMKKMRKICIIFYIENWCWNFAILVFGDSEEVQSNWYQKVLAWNLPIGIGLT